MPFDSKNFAETKPDVFSLEGLIAWLWAQDQATEYSYYSNCNCLVAQYLKSAGIRFPEPGGVGAYGYYDENHTRHPLPYSLNDAALGTPTFGAALERARKLLAAR